MVGIAGGASHSLALEAGGTVVAWGFAPYGQTNLPPGLTNAVEIAAGESYSMVLRADTTLVAWGSDLNGQTNVPVSATNVVQIGAGYYHGLAVVARGPVVWSNAVMAIALAPGGGTHLGVAVASPGGFRAQWLLDGSPLAGATGTNLVITDFDLGAAGVYSVQIQNQAGAVTRTVAVLRLTNSPVVELDGIDVGGGVVTRVSSTQVSMSSALGPAASLYYTLDGSEPDFTATAYTGPFTLTNSAMLRAIAYNPAYSDWAESAPINLQVWPIYPLDAGTPGGGTVSATPFPYTSNLYLSNSVVTLTATPSNGWSFMGWSGAGLDGTQTNVASVLMSGLAQVQAVFGTSLNLFTNGQGQILADPPVGPYAYGSTVQLTALPEPGYYFFGWAGAVTGSEDPVWVQTTDATGITALFGVLKTNEVALTVLAGDGGQVAVSPGQTVFTNGDTVILTAVPGTNYLFAGWGGDASGTQNPLVLQLDQSEQITATFTFEPSTNPPSITQQPSSATLSLGSSALLAVQVSGEPPFSYQWRLNGSPLAGQTSPQLLLTRAGNAQAGLYDVVVTNPAGTVTSAGALIGLLELELSPATDGPLPLLILDAAPGSSYRLEFTDDPLAPNWQLLTLAAVQASPFFFIDEPATNHVQRFYRAVPQ